MSGLTSQENGAIGEARSKEILIDRFWILERSVDIEGADHIIQPKILDFNMTDAEPVRVGYVQSKFRKDLSKAEGYSKIKIKENYAFDKFFRPRKEFFLFIHTGIEDNKQFYFFTAIDLYNTDIFLYDEEKEEYFYKSGADLSNYKKTIKETLEVITRNLEESGGQKNKEFLLDFLNGKKSAFGNLRNDDKYSLDLYINNNEQSVETLFEDYKIRLNKIINEYFFHGLIKTIVNLQHIDNPEKFFEELNEIHEHDISNSYSNDLQKGLKEIKELGDDVAKENILDFIKGYNQIYDDLIKKEALQKFIYIKSKLAKKIYEGVIASKYHSIKLNQDIYLTKITIKLSNKVTIPPTKFHTEKLNVKKTSPSAILLIEEKSQEKSIIVSLIWGTEQYKLNYNEVAPTESDIISTIESELQKHWPIIAKILKNY